MHSGTSVRPPQSFEAIMHNISGEFRVFHLWFSCNTRALQKKAMEFSKSLLSLRTWFVANFLLRFCRRPIFCVGFHTSFLGGTLPKQAFIGWNSDAVFDKISNISHCVLSESYQSDPWIFDLSLNNISG